MIKVIYSIFIGILLATFIGVGMAAFYPGPSVPEYPEYEYRPGLEPSAEEQVNQQEYENEYKEYQARQDVYARNASLILVGASLVVLVVSMMLVSRVAIIADGLLLGGVLTLLYGIGWSFAGGNKIFMFWMVSIGLLIALTLGYLKFVKPLESDKS